MRLRFGKKCAYNLNMFFIRTLTLAAIALMLCGCTFPLSPLMIIMLAEEPAQTQEAQTDSENCDIPESIMSAGLSQESNGANNA